MKFPAITNRQQEALLELYDDGNLNGTGYHITKGQITNSLFMKGYLKRTNGKKTLTPLAIAYIEALDNE